MGDLRPGSRPPPYHIARRWGASRSGSTAGWRCGWRTGIGAVFRWLWASRAPGAVRRVPALKRAHRTMRCDWGLGIFVLPDSGFLLSLTLSFRLLTTASLRGWGPPSSCPAAGRCLSVSLVNRGLFQFENLEVETQQRRAVPLCETCTKRTLFSSRHPTPAP